MSTFLNDYIDSKERGSDFVKGIIETSNCLFYEISSPNYRGIDAIVEIMQGEKPNNKSFALHIAIVSFAEMDSIYLQYNVSTDEYTEYIINYDIPVIGIAYDYQNDCAYWTDLSLQRTKLIGLNKFSVVVNAKSRFNLKNFNEVIITHFLKTGIQEEIIQNNLSSGNFAEFTDFLNGLFKILDFVIPLIASSTDLNDFLIKSEVKIQYFSLPVDRMLEVLLLNKDIKHVRPYKEQDWYMSDNKKSLFMTYGMFNILNEEFHKIKF